MASKTAYIFLGDKKKDNQDELQSTEEQLELFALKYHDMDKDNLKYIVENLFEEGDRLSDVLEEAALQSVIDDLGITEGDPNRVKTFLAKLPAQNKGKATFTQIACMIFNKPYEDVNILIDHDAEAKTLAATAKAKAVEDQIRTEKEAEIKAKEEEKKLEEKIKNNMNKTGVAAKAAFFEKKAIDQAKSPASDIEKTRHEAQLKKQQKAAEIELQRAKEEEEIRQREIIKQAEEVKKQVKISQLAEKMAQFGIASPPK